MSNRFESSSTLERLKLNPSICIVAVARDECWFLDEWIAYHRMLGVGHFLIYDDDPKTSLHRFLEPYNSFVTVIDWYGRTSPSHLIDRRCAAYINALPQVKDRFDWVAFLNVDEFLVLEKERDLPEFLSRCGNCSQVSFSRYLFGHNGCYDDPTDLVISSLTRRMSTPSKTIRSIVKPSTVTAIHSASACELNFGARHIDANGNAFSSAMYPGKTHRAHINHYVCRSYQRWMSKPHRGFVTDQLQKRKPSESWKYSADGCLYEFIRKVAHRYNEVEDMSLSPFGPVVSSNLLRLGITPASRHERARQASRDRRHAGTIAPASVVAYTAISDNYDELAEPLFKDAEFVAFTEGSVSGTGWRIRPLDVHCTDPNRNAKIHKVLPHRYFHEKEFSLWMDGSVRTNVSPTTLVDLFMKDFDLVVHGHPDRNCVYWEADVCKSKRLDDPEIIAAQMERYRREAYPMNAGLHENTVILRRHNRRVEAFNEIWWEEIQKGSRRDQLSSQYVARRIGLKVGYFPGSLRNDRHDYNGLFTVVPHQRSSLGGGSCV